MSTTETSATKSTRTGKSAQSGKRRQAVRTTNTGTPEAAGQAQRYATDLGICITCVHLPRCLFVKAARQPIHFCDEFDDKSVSGKAKAATKPQLAKAHSEGQGVDPGICVNCETRLVCMHRKPGETIHECEDYQ